MLRIKQTYSNDSEGDCFRACVASLLEYDINAVPDFCAISDEFDEQGKLVKHWYWEFNSWLKDRNMFAIEIRLNTGNPAALTPGAYCIVSGYSSRGLLHAVVGRVCDIVEDGIELLHDPHESNEFFNGNEPTHVMFIGYEPAAEKRYARLVERVMSGIKDIVIYYNHRDEPHTLDCSMAGRVSHLFGTGMTRSIELCREFNYDPDFNQEAIYGFEDID